MMDRHEFRRAFQNALKHNDPTFFKEDPAAYMRCTMLGSAEKAALDFYETEFKELCAALKAAGYQRVTLGVPPGWDHGPSNSISAWPAHRKRYKTDQAAWRDEDRKHLWRILNGRQLFTMGCGNGNRESWGDQAQLDIDPPDQFKGTYTL